MVEIGLCSVSNLDISDISVLFPKDKKQEGGRR